MKPTGMVRKVDQLGRVVLPIELRRTFELASDDNVEIFVDNEKIILRKYAPACMICGKIKDLIFIQDQKICRDCIEALYYRMYREKYHERGI